MTAAAVPGTVYLIHFDRRYKHAGHYLGWTRDLLARLAEHARGQGARLMAVITEAGITWRLARTWAGDRARERQIKRQGGASRCCPLCGVRPRQAAAPAARAVPVPGQAPPAASPGERGAATARILVGQQLAAGRTPGQVAAAHAVMFRDYDPLTARPRARAWHQGYCQAAAALLQGHHPGVREPGVCRNCGGFGSGNPARPCPKCGSVYGEQEAAS